MRRRNPRGGTARAGTVDRSVVPHVEQARGAAVDKRADIWAFGVVLFEMLAGQTCFAGDTITDILAAVVRAEPEAGRQHRKAERHRLLQELFARCGKRVQKRLSESCWREPAGARPLI